MTTVSPVDNAGLIQNYINTHQTSSSSTSTSTSSASSSSSTSSSQSLWGDFTTFLKILTAQLENQDPLNATDTTAFTQQLVAFAGVEQQISTNDKLDTIITSINSNGITPLLGYVGQTVEANADNKIALQDGVAPFSYTLPAKAQSATITVKDSDGNTVATMDGSTSAGVNRVAWDGSKDDGETASDGAYKIKIEAKNSNGETMTVSDIRLIGKVTGIETNSGGTTTLSVSGITLETTDVLAVYSGITTVAESSPDSSSG